MEIIKLDILFYCNVINSTGFGHGFRCIKLAKILNLYDKNLNIGLKGNISASAKNLLIKEYPDCLFFDPSDKVESNVGFIDLMFDIEDPNIYDISFIKETYNNCRELIFLSSGTDAPNLNKNITIIGYQPNNKIYQSNNIYWGLEYAPTDKDQDKVEYERENNSAFVALGGFKNSLELEIIMQSLNELKFIKTINILISPVNENINFKSNSFRKDLNIFVHKNIISITSYLKKSSFVIASYGNLCFEALSYNAPLGIIGQKYFQIQYSKLLSKNDLALSIGLPSKIGKEKVREKINHLYINRKNYLKNSLNKIPENGLKNISNIIIKKL